MKTSEEKKKFIEMRAQGLSFDKISSEIRVSKPTLVKWGQEFSKDIDNLKFIEMESLVQQYGLAMHARVEAFALLLQKAINELKERSFEGVTVKDLMNLIATLDGKINIELSRITYHTGEYGGESDFILDCMKEKTLPFHY